MSRIISSGFVPHPEEALILLGIHSTFGHPVVCLDHVFLLVPLPSVI